MRPKTSNVHILLGALLGLVGLLSSTPLLQLLGALTMLVSAALLWGAWRRRQKASQGTLLRTPDLTWAERWVPWLFVTATLLVVVVLLLFTLQQLGLI